MLPKDLELSTEFKTKHLKSLIDLKYIAEPSPELIRLSVLQYKEFRVLKYLESEYLDDKQFMMPILEKFPWVFMECKKLKSDKEIIGMVIQKDVKIYEKIDDHLKKDEDILMILNKPKDSIESIMDEINDMEMSDV